MRGDLGARAAVSAPAFVGVVCFVVVNRWVRSAACVYRKCRLTSDA